MDARVGAALDAGACDFLTKPLAVDALLLAVDLHAGSHARTVPATC